MENTLSANVSDAGELVVRQVTQSGQLIDRVIDGSGAVVADTLAGDVQSDMLSVGAYLDAQGLSVALFIQPLSDRPLVAITFSNTSDSVLSTALLY